jgi:hypothetical protein
VVGGTNVYFEHLAGTPEAMTSASEVCVVGVAAPQGAKADNAVYTGFDDLYNYTQIFEDVVELTGTQHASLIRGDENSGQLIARKQKELAEKLQSTLVFGQRTKSTSDKLYTMGGIKYLIDTYASSDNARDFGGDIWASDSDVISKIDDALDVVANKAFENPVMYVGAKFMRKFKFIQDDTTRSSFKEKARGVGVVKTYMSHLFGDIDVVLLQDRVGIMDDLVFIGDESMLGYKAHRNRGWFTTPLAKDGDSYRWQVIGEYTMKLDIPDAWVYLYNLGV